MPVKKRPRDEEQQPNEDGTPVADDEEDAEASPDDEPDMLVNCTVYQFQDNLDVDQVMQVQEMVEQMVAEVEKEACIAAASPAGGAAPETLSCFKGYIEVPHKDNEVHHSGILAVCGYFNHWFVFLVSWLLLCMCIFHLYLLLHPTI